MRIKISSLTNLLSVAHLSQLRTELLRPKEPMHELRVKAPTVTAMTDLVNVFFILLKN